MHASTPNAVPPAAFGPMSCRFEGVSSCNVDVDRALRPVVHTPRPNLEAWKGRGASMVWLRRQRGLRAYDANTYHMPTAQLLVPPACKPGMTLFGPQWLGTRPVHPSFPLGHGGEGGAAPQNLWLAATPNPLCSCTSHPLWPTSQLAWNSTNQSILPTYPDPPLARCSPGGLVASQAMCLVFILLFLAAAPSLTWPLNARNETLG